jgi:hypothetical protein
VAAPDPAQDRAARRARLRSDLADRRQLQIARLRDYQGAAQFPRQTLDPDAKVNLFIDDDGRLCAVANLLALDGQRGTVEIVARVNNTLRMADVHDGALMDWMLGSGLTQEEVVFIQEPYYFDEGNDLARAQEVERLQRHFAEVEKRLVADTDRSLDLAVDRLMATL